MSTHKKISRYSAFKEQIIPSAWLLLQPDNILLRNPPGPTPRIGVDSFGQQTTADRSRIDAEMFGEFVDAEKMPRGLTSLSSYYDFRFTNFLKWCIFQS
jgi:hypothetical protein